MNTQRDDWYAPVGSRKPAIIIAAILVVGIVVTDILGITQMGEFVWETLVKVDHGIKVLLS